MSLFVISAISTVIGITLVSKTQVSRILSDFLLFMGEAVNFLNIYQLDEEEKIRFGKKYSIRIIKKLGIVLIAIILVTMIAVIPFLFIDLTVYNNTEIVIYIFSGALFSSVIYFIFNPVKEKFAFNYSTSQKLCYYLTLGVPALQKFVFWVEKFLIPANQKVQNGIIITGLARAGTTILLHHLSVHPGLQSITYRNMPLLLGFKTWKLFSPARMKKHERFHEDGILVNLNSPEAFDEYIWRMVLRDNYCKNDQLNVHEVTEDKIREFEKYIAPKLKREQIYLSKNNNFILRLKSFLKRRSDYVILLVFRHPLLHAQSLLRQHNLHVQKQKKDAFVVDYMNWLGHYEFGLNRKEFNLSDTLFKYKNKKDINYWLERWIDYYDYALGIQGEHVYFVSNRQIAGEPDTLLNNILSVFGYSTEIKFPAHNTSPDGSGNSDQELLDRALSIYAALKEKEFKG